MAIIQAVQQLVYLEESCQDILDTIRALETGLRETNTASAWRSYLATLTFVARFADDRMLLETLTYRQSGPCDV